MEDDFNPDWVSPPGDTIKNILDERGHSVPFFAYLIGRSTEFAERLLEGNEEIDERLALRLANTLGASSGFWMRREATYRKDKARLSL